VRARVLRSTARELDAEKLHEVCEYAPRDKGSL
jgi:hypothetical protein